MAEQETTAQEQPQQGQTTPPAPYVRDPEDFEALYANSVVAEPSVWDMKVVFGILDQSSQPNKVAQHTSINLPWMQVKLLSYYIRANLAVHEATVGKIPIPASVRPPDPRTLEWAGFTPEMREIIGKIYDEFISAL